MGRCCWIGLRVCCSKRDRDWWDMKKGCHNLLERTFLLPCRQASFFSLGFLLLPPSPPPLFITFPLNDRQAQKHCIVRHFQSSIFFNSDYRQVTWFPYMADDSVPKTTTDNHPNTSSMGIVQALMAPSEIADDAGQDSPKVKFIVNIHERKSSKHIGAWFFDVGVIASHKDIPIGSCSAYLARREYIDPLPGDSRKLNFRGALKVTFPALCVLFEEPLRFFHKNGVLCDDFEAFASSFFVYDDFKYYRESAGNDKRGKDAAMHPGSRAWILTIRDIQVDLPYRRRGIGETMVRELLVKISELAKAADRPLLVVVQPGFLNDIPYKTLVDQHGHHGIHLRSEIAEVFWRSIGFERYEPDAYLGLYHWAWYF